MSSFLLLAVHQKCLQYCKELYRHMSHVTQSCYNVIGDKPLLRGKELKYSALSNFVLPGPLPNVVWLITCATPTHVPILVEFKFYKVV